MTTLILKDTNSKTTTLMGFTFEKCGKEKGNETRWDRITRIKIFCANGRSIVFTSARTTSNTDGLYVMDKIINLLNNAVEKGYQEVDITDLYLRYLILPKSHNDVKNTVTNSKVMGTDWRYISYKHPNYYEVLKIAHPTLVNVEHTFESGLDLRYSYNKQFSKMTVSFKSYDNKKEYVLDFLIKPNSTLRPIDSIRNELEGEMGVLMKQEYTRASVLNVADIVKETLRSKVVIEVDKVEETIRKVKG